jgi:hypothetical protein
MGMKKGEKYECTNPECGCEISVVKESEAPNANRAPRCCCGEDMAPKESMSRESAGRGRM